MEAKQQRQAVSFIEAGKAKSIKDAKRLMVPKASVKRQDDQEERQFNSLMRSWNAASEAVRERFRAEIDRPVADQARSLRVV